MPKIAETANVAPPLIHYYFESKEMLWREAIDHSLGQLRKEGSSIFSATRSLAPLDRLRTLLHSYAQFAARCPDHFSMIVAEARTGSDRFAWVQEHYTGLLFDDVVLILQDARNDGAIRDVPIDQLAIVLIGGILVYFTFYTFPAGSVRVDQIATDFTEMIFGMLLNGIAA